MKTICLLLLTCFVLFKSYSQSCITPLGCGNNLVLPAFDPQDTSVIDIDSSSYAASPIDPLFKDVKYTTPVPKNKNCLNSNATSCVNTPGALRYKAYYLDRYKTCKLPVVIVVHGGGFLDCQDGYNGADITGICREFARRGFVAIDVQYRLGTYVTDGFYTAQQLLAIYRSAQDIRGAIRTLLKRQWMSEPSPPPYKFDTSKVFIAGASAGSVAVMNAILYTQSMLDQVYPGISNANVLGSIDKDFYYGDDTIHYSIKGFLDMWGGLAIPPGYQNNPQTFFKPLFDSNRFPPTIIFHGKMDNVFNYKQQSVVFATSTQYGSESNCLQTKPYTYTLTTNGTDGYILGGQNIYNMLDSMGIGTELYIDCQMHHGLDTCTGSCYQSDFGDTANVDGNTTGMYIVGRAATFFQAIVNNKLSSLTATKFVECENDRVRCFTTDIHHCPSGKDPAADCPQ